mmetsp:Transcript_37225/g.54523  ORF Transcript_37225/g.54523 Transcript_37225/m.54523 type:complete len:734 (+) Transcript_37225:232-2433(+)
MAQGSKQKLLKKLTSRTSKIKQGIEDDIGTATSASNEIRLSHETVIKSRKEDIADEIIIFNTRPNRMIFSNDSNEYVRAVKVLELARKMKEGLADVTKDRRWRKHKVYKKCFVGEDAISWLMEHELEQEEDNQTNESKAEEQLDDGEKENAAVRLANEMIDAGYVSHVCNSHRFKARRNKVLFYHFHNALIELDSAELHRRAGILDRDMKREDLIGTNINNGDDTARGQEAGKAFQFASKISPTQSANHLTELELQVSRMAHSLENVSTLLDDSKGKILVLETTIRSLTLLLVFLTYVTLSIILFDLTSFGLESTVGITMKIKVFVLILLAAGGIFLMTLLLRERENDVAVRFDQRVKEHLSIVERIASDDMEGKRGLLVEVVDRYSDDDTYLSLGSKRSVEENEVPKTAVSVRDSSMRVVQAFRRASLAVSSRTLGRTSILRTREVEEIKIIKRIEMRQASDIPDPTEWPHRPVMVCVNSPVSSKLEAPKYGEGPLPVGVPFHFRSELFEGMCLVRMKDVTSDDPDGEKTYFTGRKRLFQYIVQGRFLEEIPVSNVLTGHEFVRPLKKLPPAWLLRTGISLIERVAPGLKVNLNAEQPSALAILAATAQAVSGDAPGNEPDIRCNDIKEDLSILGGIFKEGSITSAKRKKYLMNPKDASKYAYDTESIYTFDFYQNLLDMKTHSLDLGVAKLGLSKNLNGQPIQIMSKTLDGRYLFSFQIWHEKLLPKEKKK